MNLPLFVFSLSSENCLNETQHNSEVLDSHENSNIWSFEKQKRAEGPFISITINPTMMIHKHGGLIVDMEIAKVCKLQLRSKELNTYNFSLSLEFRFLAEYFLAHNKTYGLTSPSPSPELNFLYTCLYPRNVEWWIVTFSSMPIT